MYVLGLDLETTGLNASTDDIIEIGAVVWDTTENKPLRMLSELVKIDSEVSAEITNITGITTNDLRAHGVSKKEALTRLLELAGSCEYIVAHNGREFDKAFLDRALASEDMTLNKPWIDTLHDVPYGTKITSRKLTHLCAEHGFLNPFSHRAVFDVLSMLEVMSKYDFTDVVELCNSPELKLVAKVSFDDRDKAKRAGFRWDPSNKVWYKQIKECQLKSMQFEFPTETL